MKNIVLIVEERDSKYVVSLAQGHPDELAEIAASVLACVMRHGCTAEEVLSLAISTELIEAKETVAHRA